MDNKIKLPGIIVLLTIIVFVFAGCNDPIVRETKEIKVTILNENPTPIIAIWLATIAPTGNGGIHLVGTGPGNGEGAIILQNETWESKPITVRKGGDGHWRLWGNINNVAKETYPNILDSNTPPDTLELKFTAAGVLTRK
jgi:hypothetical protein